MALEFRDRIAGRLRNLMSAPLDKGAHQGQVLAVASSKGGVGKTTTAVNLSVAFSRRGARVLLVDLDPQAHVAASLQTETPTGVEALPDVLLGKLREVCEAAYPSRWGGLHLAGSDKELAETEMILSAKIGKELILDSALGITRTRYDIIVLDCPPNLGTLTLNALCAADHLLVPTDMSVLALEGVGDILSTVETLRTRLSRHVSVCGVLVTRYDKRVKQANAAVEQSFLDLYGHRLLDVRIPQSSAINRAHMAGLPIFDFAPRSPGAEAYDRLSAELGKNLQVSGLRIEQNAAAPTDRSNSQIAAG